MRLGLAPSRDAVVLAWPARSLHDAALVKLDANPMRPEPTLARALARRALGIAAASACLLAGAPAKAQGVEPLPSPLEPSTVVRIARERRPEILAARSRAMAAAQRPNIDAALPDPMIMVSMDHLPFSLMGVDGSITVQQEFPLSGILGDRRRAALADAARWDADAHRVALDLELDALQAYFMLAERRGLAPILDEQIALVEQLAAIARAHLAAGQGMEADVLRLDNERARLTADRHALDAEIRGAEAMLDAALARPPDAALPTLAWTDETTEPPALDALVREGLARRPELTAARAERSRALAEVDVMESMYTPMALVRVGPAYSMLEGAGVMAMVGVSVPLWRERLGAGVTEAQSMAKMADADIEAMRRMLAGSIASAREAVEAARSRLLALRNDILPRARLVVDTSVASFGAGQGAMVAVLDAARDLRDVRMQELMDRARLGIAWARLRREIGDSA
jgi:outer membrane protein TolC